MTITLCGDVSEIFPVQEMIEGLPGLVIVKVGDPMSTADGSGRFRIHISAALTPPE